nr:unnamed protein product [Callosobruchus chinensis]
MSCYEEKINLDEPSTTRTIHR